MAAARRRRQLRQGVVVAAALLVGGGYVAVTGYRAADSPAAIVGDYLAALAAADAPAALALGDVPRGSHRLLTSAVLRVQQHIAPLREVSVGPVDQQGSTARVQASYVLDWPSGPRDVSTSVPVHRVAGRWRLNRVAVSTELRLDRAAQRATVAGASIPQGMVLLFPGAAPITFDSPYLAVREGTAAVSFDPGPALDVTVQVSDAGRRTAATTIAAGLGKCFSGGGAPDCPQPSDRYLPGSLRGVLSPAVPRLAVSVAAGPSGVLQVSGDVPVVGSYRRLTFANQVVQGRGRVLVAVRAQAYAVRPLTFVWMTP